MFDRKPYLLKLKEKGKDSKLVALAGLKRAGKTFLLKRLLKTHLFRFGISPSNFIYISLEDEQTILELASGNFVDSLKQKLKSGEEHYLILNGIQNSRMVSDSIKQMANEKDWIIFIIDELMEYKNIHMFVVCSNTKELKRLQDLYQNDIQEIRLDPITFKEYVEWAKPSDIDKTLSTYIHYGGMPLAVTLSKNEHKEQYLNNLINLTYYPDIKEREKIRSEKCFNIILSILASNIGKVLNQNKIADIFFNEYGLNISKDTISKYLGYLEDSYLIRKIGKLDLKREKDVGGGYKYYFVDNGILNSINHFKKECDKQLIENTILNELIHNGYKVYTGYYESFKNDENGKTTRIINELDFIALKNDERYCIQLIDGNNGKIQNSINPLLKVPNLYKKIYITKENKVSKPINHEETEMMNVIDFLTDGIDDVEGEFTSIISIEKV